jgi:hypothetical protein
MLTARVEQAICKRFCVCSIQYDVSEDVLTGFSIVTVKGTALGLPRDKDLERVVVSDLIDSEIEMSLI